MTVRVIKVGGSLFDWPMLGPRLWQWLQEQPPGANYLLAGGGAWCDAVRRADETHALGDELAHELCLQLLGVSGAILERVLAQAKAAPGAATDQQRSTSILDVRALLAADDVTARVPTALPHSWEVTSDSIAAYLADAFRATELVLLKSTSLPGSMSLTDAKRCGFVDDYFPTAAARLAKVRAVNLRDEAFSEWMLFR